MNRLLITISLCWVSAVCIAQSKKTEDVLYLKTESIIRGTILSKDDQRIKIQTADGTVWVFQVADIARIAQENKWQGAPPPIKHFSHFTELGPLIAGKTTIDGVTTAAFSFQTINGYTFSKLIFTGVGIGADLYATQTIIPLFVSIRGDFSKNTGVIPFYFADAGYGLNITQDSPGNTNFKGGLLYAAGLGVKIPFNRTSGFLISFGYRYQASSYKLNGVKKDVEYNRLAIRAGFFL